MKIILLALLMTSCGMAVKAKGGTTNVVRLEGESKITVALDLSACKEFTSEEAQNKCLDLMVELIATLKDLQASEGAIKTAVETATP